MVSFEIEYISAGGNRNPAAADWDEETGLLAYGSGRNIALWRPLDTQHRGILSLLCGHADNVNVVTFFRPASEWPRLILSGSVDQTIRLWQNDLPSNDVFRTVNLLEGHTGSINCIAVSPESQCIVSGAADATIRLWLVHYANSHWEVSLIQTIQTKPRFIPLALAVASLGSDSLLVAAAGTKGDIYIYATASARILSHQATLSGHEGWIRSLAITWEEAGANSDFLLASASQDKYIRLWRLSEHSGFIKSGDEQLYENIDFESLLSNKTHTVDVGHRKYSIVFEALLLGHDDWIYTVSWQRIAEKPRLLSASADNSLAMWDSDVALGVWTCTTRLGEISAQKGSTTATGSMGGLWVGLWSRDGQSVVSLGKSGSWRLWNYDVDGQRWIEGNGISGHTKSVMDLAWAKDGSYLLSTGSDQTTRLHAGCTDGQQTAWREIARPQIHGYDLNCVDTIGAFRFVSGADEKLLRVFEEPRGTAELLKRLCGVQNTLKREFPGSAIIPVLGLSNKVVEESPKCQPDQSATMAENTSLLLDDVGGLGEYTSRHLPTEDNLARHTLWPESEKLYGHGYEISAVAASHDGSVIATACKASTLEHAVIRLFKTKDWREIKPPLAAHSLTVTRLRFTGDDQYLLSTGRDRQWAVFERDGAIPQVFKLKAKNSKAHSRMILGACWAPVTAERIFVTGGRDRTCKIWDLQKPDNQLANTISESAPVTAVDMVPRPVQGMLVLAVATETGDVVIYFLKPVSFMVESKSHLEDHVRPFNSITQASWRPSLEDCGKRSGEQGSDASYGRLALCSEDCSLRLLLVSFNGLQDANGT
ncbi:MAG: hypothetical protein Q9228_000651 [Teloschistes exilis]